YGAELAGKVVQGRPAERIPQAGTGLVLHRQPRVPGGAPAERPGRVVQLMARYAAAVSDGQAAVQVDGGHVPGRGASAGDEVLALIPPGLGELPSGVRIPDAYGPVVVGGGDPRAVRREAAGVDGLVEEHPGVLALKPEPDGAG